MDLVAKHVINKDMLNQIRQNVAQRNQSPVTRDFILPNKVYQPKSITSKSQKELLPLNSLQLNSIKEFPPRPKSNMQVFDKPSNLQDEHFKKEIPARPKSRNGQFRQISSSVTDLQIQSAVSASASGFTPFMRGPQPLALT